MKENSVTLYIEFKIYYYSFNYDFFFFTKLFIYELINITFGVY